MKLTDLQTSYGNSTLRKQRRRQDCQPMGRFWAEENGTGVVGGGVKKTKKRKEKENGKWDFTAVRLFF